MTRVSVLSASLTIVMVATVITGTGCRQAQTRSGSPTPLPGYESSPTVPDARPFAPAPPDSARMIPGVPPSTVQVPRLEGAFGFTAPKLAESEPLPALQLPPAPTDTVADEIQPTGSDDEALEITDSEVAGPVFAPLPVVTRQPATAAVELDPSLFLTELFEDAALEFPTAMSVPNAINGLTIQPWNSEWQSPSREPLPWPKDGVTSTLTITPGPIRPKWTAEPLATRPANSQPRRLMIENSDSAIRPIE